MTMKRRCRREVRVDDRAEAQQTKARAQVQLLHLAVLVRLAAGEDGLGERRGTGAGAADDAAAPVQLAHGVAHARAGERGHQL
jgi:hypothetical protein